MKTLITRSILFALVTVTPAVASAQTPRADSGAVGGDVGIFLPASDSMKSGPNLEGFYEYYPRPRTSIRLGLGWANPKREAEEDDSIRSSVSPVTSSTTGRGGASTRSSAAASGIYFLQERDNGENFGDSQTKVGGTLFGGVEFFLNNTVSVKGEARYHLIADNGAYNPDGLALTIGMKKYF